MSHFFEIFRVEQKFSKKSLNFLQAGNWDFFVAINHSGVLEMIKSPYSETLKFDLPGREHFGTTHFPSQYEAKKRDAWEMCVCNNTSLLLSLDTFMNGLRLFLLGGKLWLLELKPQPKKILFKKP